MTTKHASFDETVYPMLKSDELLIFKAILEKDDSSNDVSDQYEDWAANPFVTDPFKLKGRVKVLDNEGLSCLEIEMPSLLRIMWMS